MKRVRKPLSIKSFAGSVPGNRQADSAPERVMGERSLACVGRPADRVVEVKDDVVAELQRLFERIAIHRGATDRGKPVRRAVKIDVA